MSRQVERGTADIETLKPAPYNPRTIDEAAMAGLRKSLDRFGVVQEVVVNRRTGHIVGGHQRVAALKLAGHKSTPVAWVDLSDTDERALNLTLNNPGITGSFTDGLAAILAEVKASDLPAFNDLRLDELLASIPPVRLDRGDPDDAPPVRDEALSVAGEVYELGPHRLVCGDAADAGVWAVLLDRVGVAERLQCMWTDPPYGVAIVGGARESTEDERRTRGGLEIVNDTLKPEALRAFLADTLGMAAAYSAPGAAWYVAAPPGTPFGEFAAVLGRDGLDVWRHTLAWVKDSHVLGRADYHYRHEAILYGWTPDGPHYFVDDRTQDTVFDYARPHRNKEHPTMKPVELIAHCLRNSTKRDWLVGDPFAGSGSTLMACAVEGRIARLIELDPRYCDVIRRRWTTFARENGVDPGDGFLES